MRIDKMESIYNIEQNLLDIFEKLEENGGELTPELEETLAINQANFAEKLDNYGKAIQIYNAKIEFCKTEEKRIAALRKIREKIVEKLQTNVLTAVQMFGNTDKKGVSRFETNMFKFSTSRSNAVKINKDRTEKLTSLFGGFVTEANMNGVLYTGEDTDMIGILDSINAQYKAECEEKNVEYIPFTEEDFRKMPINISYTSTIEDFFIKHGGALYPFAEPGGMVTCIEPEINKTILKGNTEGTSFAKEVINKSLTIK